MSVWDVPPWRLTLVWGSCPRFLVTGFGSESSWRSSHHPASLSRALGAPLPGYWPPRERKQISKRSWSPLRQEPLQPCFQMPSKVRFKEVSWVPKYLNPLTLTESRRLTRCSERASRKWLNCRSMLVICVTDGPSRPGLGMPSRLLPSLAGVPVGKGARGAHAKLGAGPKRFSLTACN